MAPTAIHVVPDDNFDDWVVRNDNGHEIAHYPTQGGSRAGRAGDRARIADEARRSSPRRQNELHELYKELDREIVQNLIRPARLATVTP